MPARDHPKIAVVGLGYVGLPVAVAFAEAYPDVLGFDVDARKVAALRDGRDPNGETDPARLAASGLRVSDDPAELAGADTYVVAVPTPVDDDRRPDLSPLLGACASVGPHLRRGDLVIFESTVWPGLTEEICGPALERASGLKTGDDAATLERVASLYEAIIDAGVHRAPSIAVAEAAKVIENTGGP